jgi:hypothetical protein
MIIPYGKKRGIMMDELVGKECKVRIAEPDGRIIEKQLTVEKIDFHFIKMNGFYVNKNVIVSVKEIR